MTVRISNMQRSSSFIDRIFQNQISLQQVQSELSTGLKVINPSDDPGRSGSIAIYQEAINRIDRHKQRIAFGTNMLEHQENTLDQANNIIVRARELAEQAANGPYDPALRAQIAEEVFQLRDQMVALGNTTFQGIYIYGGADDDDPPFDSVQYAQAPLNPALAADRRYFYDADPGSQVTRTIDISDSETVRVVTPGDQVFSLAIGSLEELGRSLAGYRTDLDVNSLPDGNGLAYTFPGDEAMQTAHILRALDNLEIARVEDIGEERTRVGARIGRMETVSSTLDSLKLSTEKARASIQDSDPIDAASRFQNLETQLQALLTSGAQIQQLSLLNFI